MIPSGDKKDRKVSPHLAWHPDSGIWIHSVTSTEAKIYGKNCLTTLRNIRVVKKETKREDKLE